MHAAEPAEVGEVLPFEGKDVLQLLVHMGEHAGLVGAKHADREHAGHRSEKGFVFELGVLRVLFRGDVERRFQCQRQRRMQTMHHVIARHALLAEQLCVAAAQVLVLRPQGFEFQQQGTLSLLGRSFRPMRIKTSVLRGKKRAH